MDLTTSPPAILAGALGPAVEPAVGLDARARDIIRVLRHRLDTQSFSDELIEISVLAACNRFAAARIRAYVPLLIEHQVLDILLGRTAAGTAGSDRTASPRRVTPSG